MYAEEREKPIEPGHESLSYLNKEIILYTLLYRQSEHDTYFTEYEAKRFL